MPCTIEARPRARLDLHQAAAASLQACAGARRSRPGCAVIGAVLPRIDPWHSGAVGLDVIAASWASPAALRARQRHRLQALLAHAAARSPFYARRLRGLDPASAKLADIEPVDEGAS